MVISFWHFDIRLKYEISLDRKRILTMIDKTILNRIKDFFSDILGSY